MIDVEKLLYDSFLEERGEFELKERKGKYGEIADKFVSTLTPQQEMLFDELLFARVDMEIEIEKKLIHYILGILRGLFGVSAVLTDNEKSKIDLWVTYANYWAGLPLLFLVKSQ